MEARVRSRQPVAFNPVCFPKLFSASLRTSGACKTCGRVISVNRKEERNHVPLFRNWRRAAPPPPPPRLCPRHCASGGHIGRPRPSVPRALARILSLSSSPHVLGGHAARVLGLMPILLRRRCDLVTVPGPSSENDARAERVDGRLGGWLCNEHPHISR